MNRESHKKIARKNEISKGKGKGPQTEVCQRTSGRPWGLDRIKRRVQEGETTEGVSIDCRALWAVEGNVVQILFKVRRETRRPITSPC